jgi:predicted AAA+ superfamily ATPase
LHLYKRKSQQAGVHLSKVVGVSLKDDTFTENIFNFVDGFTALRLTATGVLLAA